jgi:TRAM domain
VARVQGLTVLNVNQLANALKPVVMAGEPMRVMILREGKEANQGVAYLDEGTMAVVDGARRYINKSVDVVVTSVHQTAMGKMIFGRVDERGSENGWARAAAVGAGRGGANGGTRGKCQREKSAELAWTCVVVPTCFGRS